VVSVIFVWGVEGGFCGRFYGVGNGRCGWGVGMEIGWDGHYDEGCDADDKDGHENGDVNNFLTYEDGDSFTTPTPVHIYIAHNPHPEHKQTKAVLKPKASHRGIGPFR
jgi:hypothetical protein